jgi:hypothetical protein
MADVNVNEVGSPRFTRARLVSSRSMEEKLEDQKRELMVENLLLVTEKNALVVASKQLVAEKRRLVTENKALVVANKQLVAEKLLRLKRVKMLVAANLRIATQLVTEKQEAASTNK